MFERREGLFRKEALDRLSSPERLDRLVPLVTAADWLLFVAVAAVVAGVLLWAVVGRVATTVTGEGILVRPRTGVDVRPGSERKDGGDADALALVSYFAVRDGKRIRPGMRVLVTPDTVRRERFGGMVAEVGSVSAFPATHEEATARIGSAEVAAWLLGSEPRIEVVVRLERDPSTPSGFRWSSSRGPDLETSPGTTATARVTVEERAPIAYVLPFLRRFSGL
jgi:hypothetical protein